jgi:hypothetical protein
MQVVYDYERKAIEDFMRAYSTDVAWSNFTIYHRVGPVTLGFQPGSAPQPTAFSYLPVLMTVPLYDHNITSVGYDWFSNTPRAEVMARANRTGMLTSTEQIHFSRNEYNGVAAVLAIKDANFTTTGTIVVDIIVGKLVGADLALNHALDDIVIAIVDLNNTIGNYTRLQGDLLFSVGYPGAPALGVAHTVAQVKMVENMLANAPFYADQVTPFADRLYRVIFMPSDAYLQANSRFYKWLGVIIPSIVAVAALAGCAVLFFLNRMRIVRNEKKRTTERYQILQSGQVKMLELMVSTSSILTRIEQSFSTGTNDKKHYQYDS